MLNQAHRDPRIPLYVPVSAGAALRDCRALNVSMGGLCVVAAAPTGLPSSGTQLDVEFALREEGQRIRSSATVQWVSGPPGAEDPAGVFTAGLKFLQPPAQALEAIRRYVEEHQSGGSPRVATPSGPASDFARPGDVLFVSEAMHRVWRLLLRVARRRTQVLLQGETGTGKELLARSLHELSTRVKGPFVTIDCGALSETLLESELFGYVRGAFTGADADRPGLIQVADGGTLFLDEIENTSPALQAKLLRVMSSGELRAVGSTRVRRVDVRIVAATNQDLLALVKAGRFRADLFYRLNTFPLEIPPLRERRDDIPTLARHFLAALTHPEPTPHLSASAETALVAYAWPGNVRELKSVMERAWLLVEPEVEVSLESLPREVSAPPRGPSAEATGATGASLAASVAEYEKSLVAAALANAEARHPRSVLKHAAQQLQVDEVTLGRKARRHGLWPRGTRG